MDISSFWKTIDGRLAREMRSHNYDPGTPKTSHFPTLLRVFRPFATQSKPLGTFGVGGIIYISSLAFVPDHLITLRRQSTVFYVVIRPAAMVLLYYRTTVPNDNPLGKLCSILLFLPLVAALCTSVLLRKAVVPAFWIWRAPELQLYHRAILFSHIFASLPLSGLHRT